MYVDRATSQKGLGVGIVIISPEHVTIEKPIKLSFSATNNKAKLARPL